MFNCYCSCLAQLMSPSMLVCPFVCLVDDVIFCHFCFGLSPRCQNCWQFNFFLQLPPSVIPVLSKRWCVVLTISRDTGPAQLPTVTKRHDEAYEFIFIAIITTFIKLSSEDGLIVSHEFRLRRVIKSTSFEKVVEYNKKVKNPTRVLTRQAKKISKRWQYDGECVLNIQLSSHKCASWFSNIIIHVVDRH